MGDGGANDETRWGFQASDSSDATARVAVAVEEEHMSVVERVLAIISFRSWNRIFLLIMKKIARRGL